MKIDLKLVAVSILVLSAIIIASVFLLPLSKGPGDYVVKPAGDIGISPEMTDAASVSYLDLPLWIKIAAIADGLLIVLGAIGLAPVIINRMQNVLANRNRQIIFNYVVSNPGCTPSEITSSRNMKNGTVKYHIQMLEQEGKIILQKMGKFTRIYRNSMGMDESEKVITSHLRNDTSRSMLQAILDEPGITNQKLSEKFGLDKSTVHWYIQKFIADNIVEAEQDGKFKKYFINTGSKEVLRKFIPLNYQCPGMMKE
ncbi:hypothetical protein CUJ83_15115 [Methanocella sp. CWC-04]|uniref:Winged helix-turn-helix DNA-binding n=1 Tax=Methanooceanicella nereidis TaxID=2052831 RepID=A0AAP2RFV6_9EURY|nr:winged helix-turn-helix transcriptional regulator [Methanocella sp. CWC-04]MCD1296332.1 hypothetical protein [Methanocella sp. CWC-04]